MKLKKLPWNEEPSPLDLYLEDPRRTRAIDRMPRKGDLISLPFIYQENVPYLVLGEPFKHTKDPNWYEIDLLDIKKQSIRTETFDKRDYRYYLTKATVEDEEAES